MVIENFAYLVACIAYRISCSVDRGGNLKTLKGFQIPIACIVDLVVLISYLFSAIILNIR